MPKANNLKAGATATAKAAPAAVPWAQQPLKERLSFLVAQYIGLVLGLCGPLVIWLGYDQGWMSNTALMMLSLAILLLGLFFHETRPYNVQGHFEEQQERREQQLDDKKRR